MTSAPLLVLFDLSFALQHISAETRKLSCELFSALAKQPDIELHGFLYAEENDIFFRCQHTTVRGEAIEYAHYFFHDALGHEKMYITKLLSILKLKKLFTRIKKNYELYPIDPIYQEVIWRNIFDRTLSFKDRPSILNKRFYFTDLNRQFQKKASLNTSAYDFVLFPQESPLKISKNSQKIMTKEKIVEWMASLKGFLK